MKVNSSLSGTEPPLGRLVLGWQVDDSLAPKFWLTGSPAPGKQDPGDLVILQGKDAAKHTAIVAQSGSGKSFFLGRLVEELLTQTLSRCVIFDPNSDFRRCAEVQPETLWTEARYDPETKSGKLPHEENRAAFARVWTPIPRVIYNAGELPGEDCRPLRLWWPALSIETLREDAPPGVRSDLFFCHQFVQAVADIIVLGHDKGAGPVDVLAVAESLLTKSGSNSARLAKLLKGKFQIQDGLSPITSAAAKVISTLPSVGLLGLDFFKPVADYLREQLDDFRLIALSRMHRCIAIAVAAQKYITAEGARFYFAKARELGSTGLLATEIDGTQGAQQQPIRLEVIDLPSINSRLGQLLAVNALLQREWNFAKRNWSEAIIGPEKEDPRVPTFIVVDEAHQLMPCEPQGQTEAVVRDQFRRIAAEGRKYGLFLIIATQRPDKIDPFVISECENKVLMRFAARGVLDLTKQALGLEDSDIADKCHRCGISRGILEGEWTNHAAIPFYAAARRTIEGGRSLNWRHWARPPL